MVADWIECNARNIILSTERIIVSMRDQAFSPQQIYSALQALPGWQLLSPDATRHAYAISKSFTFADYGQTIAFVNRVAAIAQREDHHPDLFVQHSRCEVLLSTHDCQGVCERDMKSAVLIDAVFSRTEQ